LKKCQIVNLLIIYLLTINLMPVMGMVMNENRCRVKETLKRPETIADAQADSLQALEMDQQGTTPVGTHDRQNETKGRKAQ
jgi:hypothetical protein